MEWLPAALIGTGILVGLISLASLVRGLTAGLAGKSADAPSYAGFASMSRRADADALAVDFGGPRPGTSASRPVVSACESCAGAARA